MTYIQLKDREKDHHALLREMKRVMEVIRTTGILDALVTVFCKGTKGSVQVIVRILSVQTYRP